MITNSIIWRLSIGGMKLMSPKGWGNQVDELRRSIDEAATKRLAQVGREVAQQLRNKREQRKLSQSAMATLLGTGQSRVSKMEDEDYGKLNLSSLAKAAVCLDCDLVVQIIDRRGDSPRPTDEQHLRELLTHWTSEYSAGADDFQLRLFENAGKYSAASGRRSEDNLQSGVKGSNKLRL